ncbi:protein PRRC2C isoform X2 [Hippocampus comes]|uniref:protein PRRC2C isoform X2 n=1 Tax=Hippocampus comes TaxID=109280 RepID=UPI00094E7825|nr:PREDICTED: protein PRRC2C isoform X2 [Hippocampus comes]
MSEKSGQSTKAKDGGKTKYATLSLFNTYKGKSLETQKTAVAARHGLQSLGKVAASRRMPPPANLPSLKAENKGNDPNVNIVPKDGSGWASRTEAGDERQQETPPPQAKPAVVPPQEAPTGGSRSWANSKQTQLDGAPRVSSHFHQEFPSLHAASDGEKDGQHEEDEEPYGPGPSLRPQNVGSWREGGGRNLNTASSPSEMDNRPPEEGGTGPGGGAGPDASSTHEDADEAGRNNSADSQREKRDGRDKLQPSGPSQPKLNGGQQPPAGMHSHFDPTFRSMMPPYMFHAYPQVSQGPRQANIRYTLAQDGVRAPRSARPQQPPPQAWLQDPDRPSIVSATELKELDNLDTDTDEGWAGAQMEVDYTEKLNFSDDEENQAAKEKGENWEWMGKVERMRSRPPDGQDSSEEHGGKTSWADSADPRAPSPGSAAHYNKAATLQDYQGGSRASSGGAPRGSKPAVAPADEDSEAWRQKRKKSSEVSEAVERARRRREEEERRMEEQRLAACAEKLKRLNEKHRQMTEVQASLPQTACDDAQAPKEEIQSAPDPAPSPAPSVAVLQQQASVVQTHLPERADRDEAAIKLEQVEPNAEEEDKAEVPLPHRPISPVHVVSAPEPPTEAESTLAEVEPLVDENQAERTTVPIRDYFSMEDNRVDEAHLSLPHMDTPSGEDVAVAPPLLEGEATAAMRPSLTSGYSKQFQKSLPPRFLRQQEQMKQQQWQQQQQQQQSGGSVSPSGSGGVPATQQPQQHRSMYQPIGPHHQHLASMGFDPRWIMMQSYMDPRMISGRPPMDMPTSIHAGRMPPKQIARREPGDNSSSSSDSFDHLTRPIREHGLPPDSRMVWGSDPYPPSEPLPSVTPPKGRDESKEPRIDSGLDLERGLPSLYPQEHSALDSRKNNFFRDPPEPIPAFSQSPDDVPGSIDRVPVTSSFDPDESGLPSGEEVEALGKAMLQRSVSQGSCHSLKLDEPRFDGLPLGSKALELQDSGDRADEKPQNELFTPATLTNNRATPPADGLHKPEKLPLPVPSKQKAELRWGGRPGRREGPGGERPLRRSGPIKKPVLRDMKEEREQREEREKRHERGERGDRTKKDQCSKTPSVAAAVSAAAVAAAAAAAVATAASEGSRAQGECKREAAEAEETPIGLAKARESLTSSGVPTSSSQEDKVEKPLGNEKHPEPKLPTRKESNIALRNYRREERERDRERDKEMDRDRDREWPVDANFKGRGRGEYYSRGRSFRGTYSGRGRGGRGRSREYPHREPRSRSDLSSGAVAFRNREESETRSESSDFEVIPKRRRRRGSDTDSESEGGRESASDTGPSDREPSAKPSRTLRRDFLGEVRSGLHKPGFGPPHMAEKVGSRLDDEGRPKPGFLPKGEPSRRGRGGLYSRRGGARDRGAPRSAPLRRPARESSSQWPSKPMETFRPEDMESTSRYDHPPSDRRPPRSDSKKFMDGGPQSSRERPRRSRPARPPRQDKPPRFRRLKEREAAVLASGNPGPSCPVSLPPVPAPATAAMSAPASVSPALSRAPGTPVTVPAEAAAPAAAHNLPAPHDGPFTETGGAPAAVAAAGTKSPDLSNQNSSDQANEEWETASESSDFNERREREERRGAQEAAGNATATPAPAPLQRSLTPSKSPPEGVVSPKRDGAAAGKRSFSSQRPIERQNRRGNSGAKPGRSYGGPKGDRRGGAKGGRKGPGVQQSSDGTASASGSSRSAKDQAARRKDEVKLAVKKPKENALSQFDLNNYASVVIIDDHPEVTTTDDPQSSTNDDGFTEVVSRKQQKRLQDEEKRKKEEQTTQNWGKKGSGDKSRGGGGKLPPRFAKKQSSQQQQPQQHQASSQSQPAAPASTPQVQQQPAISAPQHPHLAPAQPAASPQTLEGTVPSVPAATVEFTSKSLPPTTANAQTHGNLGTELWEKKVAATAGLPDVKKLGPISPPQPPSVSAWNKPLTSFTGTVSSEGGKSGAEGGVELAIDSIQFGAPSSAGSTDSDGVPTLLETTTDNKLPAPKEQRQKQPRAGPIKTQKLPNMEPVETKEYKPGPIGKERSLKNRKAKDARGGEGEGMEAGVPGGGVVSRTAASSPPTSDAAVAELGGDIEGMITVPSAEYTSNSKESVTDYTTPSSSLADSVPTGNNKMEESLVANVALPHSLPLPRRETLQQNSPLSTVSPATVDLTLKMESARKAWENSPSLEKNSPVTTSSSPITSCASSYSFSSASMPQIPVASVTPSTSLSGSGTYTTSSLSTKTTTASDPPNICKVKPQQLQSGSLTSGGTGGGVGGFSQLGCVPPLLPQQQQTPQVYVSQSAAGSAAQIPAFYMDTSHLFSTPHPRLAPPSLAQQQGFQPGLSQPTAVQQIPIPIYAPLQGQPQHQHTHQAQLGLSAGPPVSQPQDLFSSSLQPYRSQQAFMQSSLSQPSMMLSGPSLHSYPGVQAPELGKPQSSLAYQQPSSTQHIPILFEPQLNQPSGMGGSQLIDTHLLQARQGMSQHSNMYSGQVQQHGQSSYYSNTQSPSSAMQQVTVPLPGSQLSLANFGSGGGQPLLAMPPTPPQPQPPNIGRQPPISQPYRGLMGPSHSHSHSHSHGHSHSHSMMQPPTSKMDMDLKLFGGGMDVKPVTPPVSARSTTPTSSPYRASSTSPSSQSAKLNSMLYQKQFQPNSGSMRMTQHFPGQFNPQLLSQANMVSPLVRAPHTNSFGGGMQRSPMGPPMTPNVGVGMGMGSGSGLMPHPRPQHPHHAQHPPPRGPGGPPMPPRGTQAALKAEQDLKAKQRAEVLQSTHKFFSEQQQLSKALKPQAQMLEAAPPQMAQLPPPNSNPDADKPPQVSLASAKPVRTGPIKPQAIKPEEGK